METLKFIERQFEDKFEYHFPVLYKRFLSQTIFDNSDFHLEQAAKDDLLYFINQNNISSFIGWDENSILFSIALKLLSKQKKCFLIFFDNPNAINQIQPNISVLKTEWWNSIQFVQGDKICQSFGMESPDMFLKSVDYFNKDLSKRYFYLCEIEPQNISRYTNIYNSDVTNWFFIFSDEKDESNLKSILTNKFEKPSIEKILKLSSSIVNIQIGGDEGYLDYLLIQSKNDISELIIEIEKSQIKFITDYEKLLSECKPFDDEWKVDFYKERMTEILKNCG